MNISNKVLEQTKTKKQLASSNLCELRIMGVDRAASRNERYYTGDLIFDMSSMRIYACKDNTYIEINDAVEALNISYSRD